MKIMKFTTLLLASTAALLLSNCTSNKFVVCGHRGAMGHETENTLASIEKGMELKADMLEIDVFKIKTGEMVVFHDDDLDRITNAKGKITLYMKDSSPPAKRWKSRWILKGMSHFMVGVSTPGDGGKKTNNG